MIKLHSDPRHRARQIRWVVSSVAIVFVAACVAWWIFYKMADREVTQYTWSAHRKITHTGQMLDEGIWVALGFFAAVSIAVVIWRFRVTNRIVRPVFALHKALDELVEGNLGVRLKLQASDEFHEVGAALNKLVDEFTDTLQEVRGLVGRLESVAAEIADEPHEQEAKKEIHALARQIGEKMDFFRYEPAHVIEEH